MNFNMFSVFLAANYEQNFYDVNKRKLLGDRKLKNYIQAMKDSKCINVITNIFSNHSTSFL